MTAKSTSSAAGQVFPASPYLAGFDIDAVLSTQKAQHYYEQGYRFCVRYLSLHVSDSSGNLSPTEVTDILASGLALMAVQHVDAPGWSPNESLGEAHGGAAATNAAAAGIPQGVCVFLDLEGVSSNASQDDVTDYCKAWCKAVSSAKYLPCVYVGAEYGFSAERLSALPCHGFWKAPGKRPGPSQGFLMVQHDVHGDEVDPDITYNDANGRQAAWVASSAPTYPPLKMNDQKKMTAVMALQQALNAAGASPPLTVDGVFGKGTLAAVQSFQKSAGLPLTTEKSDVDAQTWSALVSAACPAS